MNGQAGVVLLIASLLILATAAFLLLTPKPEANATRVQTIPEGLRVCVETAFERAIIQTLAQGGSILPATTPSVARSYYTLRLPEGEAVFTILHSRPITPRMPEGIPIREAPLIPPLNGWLAGPPPLPGVNESIALAWKELLQRQPDDTGCGVLVRSMSVHVRDTAAEGRVSLLANDTPLSLRVSKAYPFADVRNALTAFALLNTASTHITIPQREGMRITFTNNLAKSMMNPHPLHGIVRIIPAYGRMPLTDVIPAWQGGVEDQLPLLTRPSCSLTPADIPDPDGDSVQHVSLTGCDTNPTPERVRIRVKDTPARNGFAERAYTVTYDLTTREVSVS